MTDFFRNGFWRTSKYGTLHWVEGHSVSRYNWDKSSSGSDQGGYRYALNQRRATDSLTSRFVNPNAKCPVCGAPVFYFQNELGSRVFFDELGPPWPKHPCTDTGSLAGTVSSHVEIIDSEPRGRANNDIAFIELWSNAIGDTPIEDFQAKYDCRPFDQFTIERRFRGYGKVLLVLGALTSKSGPKVLGWCKALPRFKCEGTVVSLKRLRLSYFDLKSMEPSEVEFHRFKNAKEFVAALTKAK